MSDLSLKIDEEEQFMATEERTKEISKELHNAVCNFEGDDPVKWAKIALAEGVDPFVATMNRLANGMIEASGKSRKWRVRSFWGG